MNYGLTVTLKEGERVRILNSQTGEAIWVALGQLKTHTARISIAAGPAYKIVREEVLNREAQQ